MKLFTLFINSEVDYSYNQYRMELHIESHWGFEIKKNDSLIYQSSPK